MFYKCQLNQVIAIGIAQVIYIFTDLLSTHCIKYWKGGVEFSKYNGKFVYFSF